MTPSPQTSPLTPHRVAPEGKATSRASTVGADQLRDIVERIERLELEKAELASDIKDIFLEAKSAGFDVKTLRKIVALRKQDAAERDEADYLLDTYKRALGMQPDLFDGESQ